MWKREMPLQISLKVHIYTTLDLENNNKKFVSNL